MKTKKKAFTLVELLVVIAILAILATVSILGYTSFTKKAKESNAKSEMAQFYDYMLAQTLDGKTTVTINVHNYTDAEAKAYNSKLDGGVDLGSAEKFDDALAAKYNATLTGAISTSTKLTADEATALNAVSGVSKTTYAKDNTPTEADAKLYNASLTGRVASGDKISNDNKTHIASYNASLEGSKATTDVKVTVTFNYNSANNKVEVEVVDEASPTTTLSDTDWATFKANLQAKFPGDLGLSGSFKWDGTLVYVYEAGVEIKWTEIKK